MHGVFDLDTAMLDRTSTISRHALPALAERAVPANFARLPEEASVDRFVVEACRWRPEIAASLIADHWQRDYRGAVRRIDVPTLLVAGSRSAFTPIGAMMWLEQKIPLSRLEIFEDCGHAPFFERPDIFNASLGRFLSVCAQTAAGGFASRLERSSTGNVVSHIDRSMEMNGAKLEADGAAGVSD